MRWIHTGRRKQMEVTVLKLPATVGMWVDARPVRMTTRLRPGWALSQLVMWWSAAASEGLRHWVMRWT
jgi:hypothetical protein